MHPEQYLLCSSCAEVCPAETPPCTDGHGPDCPDRACTICGTALFVGPAATRDRPRPATGPAARRAA